MKLGIFENKEFLTALNELNSIKLPVGLAYKLSKVTTRVAEEQKTYFKLKDDLIQKYVAKKEDGTAKIEVVDGNRIQADFGDNENVDKYVAELRDLEMTEVDITPVATMEELVGVMERESISIAPAHLNALKYLFNTPEEAVQ
jgi:hypothetical protein